MAKKNNQSVRIEILLQVFTTSSKISQHILQQILTPITQFDLKIESKLDKKSRAFEQNCRLAKTVMYLS